MPRTYTNLLTHIIFSTKNRLPQIRAEMKRDLHAYLWGIATKTAGVPVAINGMPDHVHLLISLRPDVSASEAVRVLKSNSSKWAHEELGQPRFAWQLGFSAFSVSKSNVAAVAKYIAEQEEHHQKMTFQHELISFLKKNGIEYDERYIWQ
ncbi:MAG TPA: IS200/IS605 family transposase [Terriglobales bacterium]|nr:IS200/IS605 family transposase [Terriglobales bacterium]